MVMTAETKTKRTEYERYGVRAKALLEEFPNGLPAAKATEFDDIVTKMGEIEADIKSTEAAEERKQALEHADRFLNDPQRKIPHGINGDSDDRKKLRDAGWEMKTGIWYAPTSIVRNGQMVMQEMYPDEVLFGDVPTDDDKAARYFKQTRATMSDEYKSAYCKHLSLSVKYRSESMALTMMTPAEQKALSEGSDTAGGFLVPPDVQADMLSRVAQTGVIRNYATVRTTSRDRMEFPAVAPNTTAATASIYSSGFVGGWVGETPAFSDTDPTFQMFPINIRKIRVATKLSNDFVADAAQNVLSFLSTDGSKNMALVEDNGFLTGDGGPLQPMGLLNAGITTFDVEGTTTNTVTNTTSSGGSFPKIVAGTYQLPAQYVANARWLMRRTIEGKTAALIDANGRPQWAANAGSGFGLPERMLQGFPVSNSDWMPDDGTDANKVYLLGDFSNYIIAQRAQITSVVLRERFADTDQVGIILFERVGGGVWNLDAFRVGIV